ncbi:MAG: hypothetical protein ACYDAG_06165 [Chloroflexota bacterium]
MNFVSLVADTRKTRVERARGASLQAAWPRRSIFGLTVSLAATLPFWAPGYLLVLDSVAGPISPWPLSAENLAGGGLQSGLPWSLAAWAAAHVGLSAEFQKLVLSAAVFFAAWGAARLVRRRHSAGWLYASVLYAINPWVYDRVWAGQVGVIMAYALLPLFVAALLKALARPGLRRVPALALLAGCIGVFDTHLLYLLPAMVGLAWLCRLLLGRGHLPRRALRPIGMLAGLGLTALGLGAYWLLPARVTHPLANIGKEQLAAFATQPDPRFGLVFNAAALYGFWRPFNSIKDGLPYWWALYLAIAALALVGLVALLRTPARRWRGAFFVALWLLGMFLALGTAFAPSRGPFLFLFDHLPGFAGLREPQKALALVALAYMYLGADGVDAIVRALRPAPRRDESAGDSALRRIRVVSWLRSRRRFLFWDWPPRSSRRPTRRAFPRRAARAALTVCLVALPLVYGYRELWGQWGGLRPVEYPDSWRLAANYLRQSRQPGEATLFLPWELYQPFDFTRGLVVASPASFVFPGPVLTSDTTKANGVMLPSGNARGAQVEQALAQGPRTRRLGALLAPFGVRYVLLAQGADWQRYGFLNFQDDLLIVRRWPDLILYQNTEPLRTLPPVGGAAPAAPAPEPELAGLGLSGAVFVLLLAALARLTIRQPVEAAASLVGGGWRAARWAGWIVGLAAHRLAGAGSRGARALAVGAQHAAGRVRAHPVGALLWLLPAAAFPAGLWLWHDAGYAFWAAWGVASVTRRIPSRLSIALGLVFIAACVPALMAYRGAWLSYHPLLAYWLARLGVVNPNAVAEEFAVWAYGFLAAGVLAAVVDVARQRGEEPEAEGEQCGIRE